MWVPTLGLGLVGFGLLAITYAGFEHHWPTSYRNLSDTYGLRVTARLWRLVCFRAAPVYITATLLIALADRAHANSYATVAVAVGIHSLLTNGRAFVNGIVPGRPEAVINYGSYHLLAVLISSTAAVLAFLTAPVAQKWVPTTTSLTESLWTAGLVAVIGAFLLRLTTKEEDDEDRPNGVRYWYERAVRDTGIETFDRAFTLAAETGTDPLVVRAVAVAEILQRPRWLRRAERVLGTIRRRGSYGVMQMGAFRPLSDEESIALFCYEFSGLVALKTDETGRYAEADSETLWQIGGKHNGNRAFIDTVTDLYSWFAANSTWVQSDDAFGLIGIIEKRRYAEQVGFRIATTSEAIEISTAGGTALLARPTGSPVGQWWWLESRIPIGESGLWIREEGAREFALVKPGISGFFV